MKSLPPDRLTRLAHWVTAVAIGGLIITGFMLMGDSGEGSEAALGGDPDRAGYAWHIPLAYLLTGIGLVYALTLIATGRWRMFSINKETFKSAFATVRNVLLGRSKKHEPGVYNGAQILAYAAVLLMALGEVVTGFALFFGHRFPGFLAALGGRDAVSEVHEALMFGIIAFIVVHVVQVIRAGGPVLGTMLLGPFGPAAGSTPATRAAAMLTAASVTAAAIAVTGTQFVGPLRDSPTSAHEQSESVVSAVAPPQSENAERR